MVEGTYQAAAMLETARSASTATNERGGGGGGGGSGGNSQAQRWRRSIQWGGAQHPEVNFNGELKDDDGCHDNDNDNRALRRFRRLLHPLSSPRSLEHAAARAPSGGSDSLRWWGHHRQWSSVMGGG
uniref:Uncharacterized protein n=1 Tax=Oryza nivara TaxID=4536 RepID=A0A0E0G7P8_ORYNI